MKKITVRKAGPVRLTSMIDATQLSRPSGVKVTVTIGIEFG